MTLDQMEPVWKIETNDTGFQFWSRSCTKRQYRVKFKCEVEVLEFAPTELDVWFGPEDSNNYLLNRPNDFKSRNWLEASNKRYTTKCRTDLQEDTSALMSVLCLMVIIVTMSYKWWTFVTST